MSISGIGLGPWFHKKIVDPLSQILSRGAEPKQLAFSAALGITLGVFPICGVTVFLCAMAIAALGSLCHSPSVMLANFIATPIELSLVVPFLRFGEVLSGGPHFPLTSDALKKVLTGQASHEILLSVVHVVVVGVARRCTLYSGIALHIILAMFQASSPQVQQCPPFKP
ncbi:uncharacterized protein LOC131152641 isoform X2 [Malania oleifera]|uniref:uncharacterized protein LOC131152641 isoform X2 n=1 Tax=Malania oleifera TaxID=397392 RepID=UPI0025AE8CF0|nr:uncharacterized protein LOC131152641 isoform X2 [Malania oleifera]